LAVQLYIIDSLTIIVISEPLDVPYLHVVSTEAKESHCNRDKTLRTVPVDPMRTEKSGQVPTVF